MEATSGFRYAKSIQEMFIKVCFWYVECKTNVHEKCAYLILQFSALLQVKGPWQKCQVLSVLSNSIFKSQTSNQRKQYIWHQRQNAKINRMICLQNQFVFKPLRPYRPIINTVADKSDKPSFWDCMDVYRLSLIGIKLTLLVSFVPPVRAGQHAPSYQYMEFGGLI